MPKKKDAKIRDDCKLPTEVIQVWLTTSFNTRKEQLHTAGKEKRLLHDVSQGTPTQEITFQYFLGDILANNTIPPLKSCFEYQEIAQLGNR